MRSYQLKFYIDTLYKQISGSNQIIFTNNVPVDSMQIDLQGDVRIGTAELDGVAVARDEREQDALRGVVDDADRRRLRLPARLGPARLEGQEAARAVRPWQQAVTSKLDREPVRRRPGQAGRSAGEAPPC